MRVSSADWFKADVARQRVGPISLGIAPRACTILSKLLLRARHKGGFLESWPPALELTNGTTSAPHTQSVSCLGTLPATRARTLSVVFS